LHADTAEAKVVINILIDIAREYPQAVYYPFRISSEYLSPAAEEIIQPLKKLLHKPLLDSFVASLGKLTHPEHRFKDWIESMKAC
jgi:DNA-dependent protein kinase catalytic subunit